MSEEAHLPEEQTTDRVQMIYERIKQGADVESIIGELVSGGMIREDAEPMVNSIYSTLLEGARKETLTGGAVVGAVVLGGVAAVVAAVIWLAIVIFANLELGLAAWGVGLLVGFAVSLGSGKRRGRTLQIIAVAWSVLGIGMAKGVIALLVYAGSEAGEFSWGLIVGGMDIVFFGFAIYTAWRMLRGSGIDYGSILQRPENHMMGSGGNYQPPGGGY